MGKFPELDKDQLQRLNQEVFSSMEAFISLGPKYGVANFILKGPIDVPTRMDAWVRALSKD